MRNNTETMDWSQLIIFSLLLPYPKGIGVSATKENMKLRRSIQVRGENNPNYGNHKLQGKNNPFYMKTHSIIAKEKMSKNHVNVSGKHNPQYNTERHAFYNVITKETFYGTPYEFYNKSPGIKQSGLSMLINGHRKHYKKWILKRP